jgi:hypothetical protein
MVAPQKTSGSNKAVALLGVAVLLLVGGVAGVVWAWKSGRLFGGSEPGVAVASPSQPAEPPKDTAPSTQTPAEPAAGQAAAPTESAQQNGTPPTEPTETGTEANPPVAEANGSQGGEPSTEENTPEQGNPGEEQGSPGEEQGSPGETQAPEQTPPPAENQLAPGCYTVVVAFESSRGSTGAFGPWEPVSENSRTSVSCDSVPKGRGQEPEGVYAHWPESPSEQVLHTYKTLSFQPQKKGAPNTRRMVMKVNTRVSG